MKTKLSNQNPRPQYKTLKDVYKEYALAPLAAEHPSRTLWQSEGGQVLLVRGSMLEGMIIYLHPFQGFDLMARAGADVEVIPYEGEITLANED